MQRFGIRIALLLMLQTGGILGLAREKLEESTKIEQFTSLEGHTDHVFGAEFDRSGRKIVTASRDKTARVWELEGKMWHCTAVLEGHIAGVYRAVFDSAGTKIATASFDKTVHIWALDEKSWNLEAVLVGHSGPVAWVEFDNSGKRMATRSIEDKTVRVWLRDGKAWRCEKVLEGHTHYVLTTKFNTDGTRILSCSSDGTVRVWSLDESTWNCEAVIKNPRSVAQKIEAKLFRDITAPGAVFDKHGKRIVIGSLDNIVRVLVFDGKKWCCEDELVGCKGEIVALDLDVTGRIIRTVSLDKTVRIWVLDGNKWYCERVLSCPGKIRRACFDKTGTKIFIARDFTSADNKTAQVLLLDGNSYHSAVLEGHTQIVNRGAFDGMGTKVVTASFDKTARVWELTDASTGYAETSGRDENGSISSKVDFMKAESSEPPKSEHAASLTRGGSHRRVIALWSLISASSQELSFNADDEFDVLDADGEWLSVRNASGAKGWIPRNYVKDKVAPTGSLRVSPPITLRKASGTSPVSMLDKQSLTRQGSHTVDTPLVINSKDYLEERLTRKHVSDVNSSVAELQSALKDYQNELINLGQKTDKNATDIDALKRRMIIVASAVQSQLLHKKALEVFAKHSNLRVFYHTLMCLIESAFLSYKAAAGGVAATEEEHGGTKEKALGMAASGVRILGNVLSFIPGASLVGKALGGVMDGVQQGMVDKLNSDKAILVHKVNLLMDMHAASEIAITVAYHLTESYAEQLNALLSCEDFEKEMSKIGGEAPSLKKRAMVIAQLLNRAGQVAIAGLSSQDFFSEDLDWEKLCGVGGRFVTNIVGTSSHDMIPFAQAAAEYAALHIFEAITSLRSDMNVEQMIKHLEHAVYTLKASDRDNNRSDGTVFSSLIAKVKSAAAKKNSVSLLFRTVDSGKIQEVNVHDLFALPGVKVAGQLFSNASCNPRSFGYINGTMDLVSLRSGTIVAPSSRVLANQKIGGPPPTYPRIITKQDRAWEFLAQAIAKKEFAAMEEIALRTMITEQQAMVIDCCTASTSYETVMVNWKALIGAQSTSSSLPTQSPATKTVDLVSLSLELICEASQQKLISSEEEEHLISLVSAGDKFMLGSVMKAGNSLHTMVKIWKIHLRKGVPAPMP